jgi:phosphoribosyl 1,2-cyclic phosphodiesterase
MSGSSGNSIYIETSRAKVLIDAGNSGKAIALALNEACGKSLCDLDALLITHGHRDHIMGAGVLARKYKMPVYATEGTWSESGPLIGKIEQEQKRYINVEKSLEIGDLKIEAFPLSHDSIEPVGFHLAEGVKSLGIATDSGVYTSRMEKMLRNVDCLVLEANHDLEMLKNGPYPWPLKKRISSILGHLSNESAGQALLRTLGGNSKHVILAHLSQENNKPSLALETVIKTLEESQFSLDDVDITVAPRYKPGAEVVI